NWQDSGRDPRHLLNSAQTALMSNDMEAHPTEYSTDDQAFLRSCQSVLHERAEQERRDAEERAQRESERAKQESERAQQASERAQQESERAQQKEQENTQLNTFLTEKQQEVYQRDQKLKLNDRKLTLSLLGGLIVAIALASVAFWKQRSAVAAQQYAEEQ